MKLFTLEFLWKETVNILLLEKMFSFFESMVRLFVGERLERKN